MHSTLQTMAIAPSRGTASCSTHPRMSGNGVDLILSPYSVMSLSLSLRFLSSVRHGDKTFGLSSPPCTLCIALLVCLPPVTTAASAGHCTCVCQVFLTHVGFVPFLSIFFLATSAHLVTTYDASPAMNGPGLLTALHTLISDIKDLLPIVMTMNCSLTVILSRATPRIPKFPSYRYYVPHLRCYNISLHCIIPANNQLLLCL